jgi:hypothetical protein
LCIIGDAHANDSRIAGARDILVLGGVHQVLGYV